MDTEHDRKHRVSDWIDTIPQNTDTEANERKQTALHSPVPSTSAECNRRPTVVLDNEFTPSNSPPAERTTLQPCTNERCKNFQANIHILSQQMAAFNRQQREFENAQTELEQMSKQLAEHSTYVENLTEQIYEMKNQLRKAELERDTAKEREADMRKQLDLIETHSATLRKKAEERDSLERRYLNSIRILEDVQKKRVEISEKLNEAVAICKQSKTSEENLKNQCEKLKADKAAAMQRVSLYKKHVPTMLKLINELAPYADKLSFHSRKRIDALSEPDLRILLLGGQVLPTPHDGEHDGTSDEESVDDFEALISSEAMTPISVKKTPSKTAQKSPLKADQDNHMIEQTLPSPKEKSLLKSPAKQLPKKESAGVAKPFVAHGGRRGRRNEQHNVDDAEKAFNARLISKLNRNDVEPSTSQTEVPISHNTIHGKKGPTMREQQAKMMSVSEKVALMRQEQKQSPGKKVPPPLQPLMSIEEPKSVKDGSTKRWERHSTPDLQSDLRLTPSPVKLTPAQSLEFLLSDSSPEKEEIESSPKKILPAPPSMPHLEAEEPYDIPEQAGLTKTSFASMPHLDDICDNQEMEQEVEIPSTSSLDIKKSSPKQKTPKKVTFHVPDLDEVFTLEANSNPLAIESSASEDVVEELEKVDVETPLIETRVPTTMKIKEKVDKKTGDQPTILPEKESEKRNWPKVFNESGALKLQNKATEKPTTPLVLPTKEKEKSPTESTSSSLEWKLSTPTKKALTNISGVSKELQSPLKAIPEWSDVASRYNYQMVLENADEEDFDLSSPSQEVLTSHSQFVPNLEIALGDDQDKSLQEVVEQDTNTGSNVSTRSQNNSTTVESKTKVIQAKLKGVSAADDNLSASCCSRTRSAPLRPTAPKRRPMQNNVEVSPTKEKNIDKTITKAPAEETLEDCMPSTSNNDAVSKTIPKAIKPSATQTATATKVPAQRKTQLTTTIAQSRIAQLEQTSRALSRRLKAANTRPLPAKKVPIEKSTVKIQKAAIKIEELPQKQDESKTVGQPEIDRSDQAAPMMRTRRTKQAAPIPMIEPIQRPATRQLKRKAANDSLPFKKTCQDPAEALLRKALELECDVDTLGKKIPPEELQIIRNIEGDRFAEIMIEHVTRMKSVDMWQLVHLRYSQKTTEGITNKLEEYLLQVSNSLCSENADIFSPFIRQLIVKLMSQTNLDAMLCHKLVRLVAMSIQAKEQMGESDFDGKQQIRILVQFLAMQHPCLLGEALIYIVIRLPLKYLEIFTDTKHYDLKRILVLYSEEEILKALQFFWEQKDNKKLELPSILEVESWIRNNTAITEGLLANVKVINGTIIANDSLKKMLLLRAMYLSTHKLFPEALAETRELVSQLETFVETYNINEETDEIIGTIFGSSSQAKTITDPDSGRISLLAVRIEAVMPLISSALSATNIIGRDKVSIFINSIGESIDIAHDILEFLDQHQENAPERRRLLQSVLRNFLSLCQPLTQHSLS